MTRKKDKFIKLKENVDDLLKYNFELYEDEPLIDEGYKKFLENEQELENIQMMMPLKHEEIFSTKEKSINKQHVRSVAQSATQSYGQSYGQSHGQKMNNCEEGITNGFMQIDNTDQINIHSFQMPATYTVVAPKHLRSLAEICKTYGKGRESVKKWYAEGAPIAFDGFSYFSEYHALQNWLVERGRKLKAG